jgi:hypothetical protein
LGAGQPDRCAGAEFCNAQLQCVECNNGDLRCIAGGGREQCTNGFWQNANCLGNLQCTGQGSCLAPAGGACTVNTDCATGLQCRNWSPDNDGDGFGDPTETERRCGAPGQGFVENATDCCDDDEEARPGQVDFFDRERLVCGGYDFNCDRSTVTQFPVGVCAMRTPCPNLVLPVGSVCGQEVGAQACTGNPCQSAPAGTALRVACQ